MGSWSQQSLDDTTFDIFRPQASTNSDPTFFFLRDEDQQLPLRDPQIESLLDEAHVTVVAPLCRPIWSLDVETTGQIPRILLKEHLLPATKQLSRASENEPASKIALVGHGMGGQALLRFAYDFPHDYPVVAAIEPKIDFHLLHRAGHPLLQELFPDEEAARQHTPILHVHPLNWPRHQFFCADPMNYPWFDGADRLRMKLAASGIQFDCELELSADDSDGPYFRMVAERVIRYCCDALGGK